MKSGLFIVLMVLLFPVASWSLDSTTEFGARGGLDKGSLHESYAAGEIYYLQDLPWQKRLGTSAKLYTRLDVGAGYLRADSQNGGWLAAGMDVVLSLVDGLWDIEGGFRPTWLFKHEIGEDDFGGPVQFSSHVGATLNLDQIALSYRYQHISNSDVYNENPGHDLHLVGIGMRF